MASKEVTRYVEALVELDAANQVVEEAINRCDAARDAVIAAEQDVLPPRLVDLSTEGLETSSLAHRVIRPALLAEYVWFPLLVDEFDGDHEAAEAAWALGQRPIIYLKDSA